MKYLDLTLPSPHENLACDEALLDQCEENRGPGVLRTWESKDYFVVLGHACKARADVNLAVCHAQDVPILRRCSGGGTVVQGPGCLNYAVVLRTDDPETATISSTNRFVMERHRQIIRNLGLDSVQVSGITDLAVRNLKFSGNAQRRKQHYLLFHGTFLLNFDLRKIDELLHHPERQPDYRQLRSHRDFLVNIGTESRVLKQALRTAWEANEFLEHPPLDRIDALVRDRYTSDDWNFKFP